MNPEQEKELFAKIKHGHIPSFEKLFHNYYGPLCLYATKITNNAAWAEEIVQDFFVKFWEKKSDIEISSSIKSYFFQSVKNACFNFMKHNAVVQNHIQQNIQHFKITSDDFSFSEINLFDEVEKSIISLPEKRREIFRMSREEGLKYREIAKKLNISIKTVETQMSLAINTLRTKLKHFLVLIIVFIQTF